MAQSALTVTTPNPTPPTNFSCTGATPPNPPNFTKNNYLFPFGNPPGTAPFGQNPNPPPYFDDGAAGTISVFAANTAALAGGTGATAGGTDGTYPGTGTPGTLTSLPNNLGAVPASTSVAAEGAGTEVLVTAPGSRAECPTISVSCLGSYTNLITNGPNSTHASSLSPATAPTLTSAGPSTASGTGNATVTATGTGFVRSSIVYVNGVACPTTYVSATSLTAVAAKKATSGTLPVFVVTNGVATAPQNWTFT